MKNFRRVLCFLLMFVTIGFFTACSKSENPPGGSDDSGLSSGGGSEDSGSGDSGGGSEEVYVAYTSSEIMLLGANFVESYFDDFEADTNDENLFDDNVDEMKVLLLNATKMIEYVSEIEDLTFGVRLKGSVLELDDYQGKPNAVAKFYVTETSENSDGNASVRITILFSHDSKSVEYSYDYYDILIETNKKQKLVSCDISIERSVQKTGLEDSSAKYFVFDLDGDIDGGNNFTSFNAYKFERNVQIEDQTIINYNVIDNFAQSFKDSKNEFYVGGNEAELLLRNASSSQSILVSQRIGNLRQRLKKLSGNALGTISGLSEALTKYVDLVNEIV